MKMQSCLVGNEQIVKVPNRPRASILNNNINNFCQIIFDKYKPGSVTQPFCFNDNFSVVSSCGGDIFQSPSMQR